MIENVRPIFPNQAIPAVFGESVSYTQQVAYLAYKLQECIEWINDQKAVEIPIPSLEDVAKVLNVINSDGEPRLGWNGTLPADVSNLKSRTSTLEDIVAGKQEELFVLTATLDAGDEHWPQNTQVLTVEGVLPNDILIVAPDASDYTAYTNASIYAYSQATNTVSFKCAVVPDYDITVRILVCRPN